MEKEKELPPVYPVTDGQCSYIDTPPAYADATAPQPVDVAAEHPQPVHVAAAPAQPVAAVSPQQVVVVNVPPQPVVVVPPQPVAAVPPEPAVIVPPQPEKNTWAYELFHCFEDPPTCFVGMCCPCVGEVSQSSLFCHIWQSRLVKAVGVCD